MFILSVDTSTRSGSIAVLREAETMSCFTPPADKAYSGWLSCAVDRLLIGAGLGLRDIGLFAVASGPGSFTGLRVGLTAVKAWAEVFSKPIAAVSALEAIAAQAASVPGTVGRCLLAPVLDAHRGQVFGGLFRANGEESGSLAELLLEPVAAEIVTSLGEFVQMAAAESRGTGIIFASPTPELVQTGIAEAGVAHCGVVQVSNVLAPVVGQLGYQKALRGDLVDSLRLDANYVRRSDAELHWKE